MHLLWCHILFSRSVVGWFSQWSIHYSALAILVSDFWRYAVVFVTLWLQAATGERA